MIIPMVFSQRDARWKAISLGGSRVTIGDYGCLVTAYAMVLRYYGWQTDPKMLNELFTKAKGFDANGSFFWDTATKVYGGSQVIVDAQNRSLTDSELTKLLDALAKGYPVIIQVDLVPASSKANMHFVVGYDYKGGDILIADPWTGNQYALRSKYGSSWSLKRAIYRYVIFKPEQKAIEAPKPSVPKDKSSQALSDMTKKYESAKSDVEKYRKKADDLEKDLSDEKKKRQSAEDKIEKVKSILK